jgi:hypothetical protein
MNDRKTVPLVAEVGRLAAAFVAAHPKDAGPWLLNTLRHDLAELEKAINRAEGPRANVVYKEAALIIKAGYEISADHLRSIITCAEAESRAVAGPGTKTT